MNLQEAKALFFAQYLGQKVSQLHRYKPYTLVINVPHAHFEDEQISLSEAVNFAPSSTFLLLRSIDQLTDEEKETVCKISYLATVGAEPTSNSDFDKERHIKTGAWLVSDVKLIPLATTDYLRCIGILLPFTYLGETNKPVTLTPDQIINLGWAKYKTI